MVYVLLMEDDPDLRSQEPVAVRLFATKAAAKAALLERLKLDYAHPDGGYGELDDIIDGSPLVELDDEGISEEAEFSWSIFEREIEV
jgi:hypothetical protein